MSKSWEQILGGYATDTLTEEDKQQLFEAALHDQTLFDTLADEEALKALLADPEARQRILASLQTSGEPQGGAPSSRSRLSWFHQPSSLAWVGSIAAMGLALIFGWQMEKDWGPLVKQEQQVERSTSQDEDSDKNEETFRSQVPETVELKEQAQDPQKKDQREPERVAALSDPVPSPQPSTISETSSDSERRRQSSAQFRSEDLSRQEARKEDRLKAKASVPQSPESAIVQNVPEEEQGVVPPVASPDAAEEGLQQFAQAPSFADKLEVGNARSSPKARELFYANKRRADVVGEELDGRQAQQRFGELSSIAEKALTEKGREDLRGSREVVQDDSQGQTRGIRYSFVRPVVNGQDEAIDITQFSGKWSELQLAIESNVSGHLYVLIDYGNGKWQLISPESLNTVGSGGGAIKVKAYQPVIFPLRQVANTLGRPVVSSITVLLSSTPLTDLGKWLGRDVNSELTEGRLTEQAGIERFVIDHSLNPETPMWVNIALEKE